MYVYLFMCVYAHEYNSWKKPKEPVGSPEAGNTENYELPKVG